MLIDLSSIDPNEVARKQDAARVRIELSRKTVRQLREFARNNHISLVGVSSKRAILDEIMGQYGHQWGPRNG